MMVYRAMQQHLVFLSALAISPPSLGLCCAIPVLFPELAAMGERRGEETVGKGRVTRALFMRHPCRKLCLNQDLHSHETWDKESCWRSPSPVCHQRRRLQAGESCCTRQSSLQLCCHSAPKSHSRFR